MERVKWEKPRAEVQAFVADDYVAACWDVLCDGSSATILGRWVYQDNNGNKEWDSDEPILSYDAYGDNQTYLVKTEGDAPPSYNAMVYKLIGDDYPVYYFGNDHISLLNLNSYKHNNRPNHS